MYDWIVCLLGDRDASFSPISPEWLIICCKIALKASVLPEPDSPMRITEQ